MPKGIAIVEHRVSDDPLYCEYFTPDDGFCERTVCRYLCMELKTAGKGVRHMYKQPRCSLFREWLDRPSIYTLRCDKCKLACGEEV